MLETVQQTGLATPIGPLVLVSNGCGLTHIRFGTAAGEVDSEAPPDEILREAAAQLRAYFRGQRTEFDLPLAAAGTEFQLQVWDALRHVPYGQTTSYARLAQRIGRPAACRAVGAANGANPLPIVIPCHRVVGANGTLTGYAGGLEIKRRLLAHEANTLGLCHNLIAGIGVGRPH